MAKQRTDRQDSVDTGKSSGGLIVVGTALWFFASVPWSFSVDETRTALTLTTYVSLLLGVTGALIALAGVRRLLARVQPRLLQISIPPRDFRAGTPGSKATPRALITAGVLMVVAADVTLTIASSGGALVAALVVVASLASFVGPFLILAGVYKLVRLVERRTKTCDA